MAFIYDELPKDIDTSKVGYFETLLKDFQEIEPNLNFVYNLSGTKSISKDTVVIYYTGAFTYFHKGHYNLIEKSYNDLKKKCKLGFVSVLNGSKVKEGQVLSQEVFDKLFVKNSH